MLTRLETAHQAVVPIRPEDGAADGGLVEVAEPEVHIGLAATAQAHFLGLDGEALHAAISHQISPCRYGAGGGERGLGPDHRFEDAHLFGYLAAGGHHHLVLRDHGHRGTGDGVKADQVFLGA